MGEMVWKQTWTFESGWWFRPPLWKIWKSIGMIIPNIWENKECSKPPTSEWFLNVSYSSYSWIVSRMLMVRKHPVVHVDLDFKGIWWYMHSIYLIFVTNELYIFIYKYIETIYTCIHHTSISSYRRILPYLAISCHGTHWARDRLFGHRHDLGVVVAVARCGSKIRGHGGKSYLVGGLGHSSETYMKVNWDDDYSQYVGK